MTRSPAQRTASSVRLSLSSLTTLGAPSLAQLLMEAAATDANLKRRLRLELAAEAGPQWLAAEIDKRLASLGASRARISWRKRPELLADLEAHRKMIVERLANADPPAALGSILNWFELFRSLQARVKDPRGELILAFESAAPDLWRLASAQLGEGVSSRLAQAILAHPLDYARWIGAGADELTPDLAQRLLEALNREGPAPSLARGAVRRLADRAGDLDLWLSLLTPEEQRFPDFAAQVARRLMSAGRNAEARTALEKILHPGASKSRWQGQTALSPTAAWEAASIDLLEAEGRKQEAQDLRWAMFERDLNPQALRDYLSRLPDFDDVEALDRAFAYAAAFPSLEAALTFLMDWPAYREAASLIERRAREAQRPMASKADWAARLAQRFPGAAEILGGR